MGQNLGLLDRTARIISGLLLISLGRRQVARGKKGFFISLLGLGILSGGVIGYCVGYGLMGISTNKRG